MKKLITLLAVVAGFAVLAPAPAQAGHGSSRSYSHSCGSCRTPIYRERVFVGYDRHGCAMYSYRTVGHSCRPSYGYGGGYGGGYNSGYGNGCNDHGRGGHISRSGFSFSFGGRR